LSDYGVYAALIAVYFALFYFFIKETKGLTVEEAAIIYESDATKEATMEEERRLRAIADVSEPYSEKMDEDERIKGV
jgi:hypothetical protein